MNTKQVVLFAIAATIFYFLVWMLLDSRQQIQNNIESIIKTQDVVVEMYVLQQADSARVESVLEYSVAIRYVCEKWNSEQDAQIDSLKASLKLMEEVLQATREEIRSRRIARNQKAGE